MAIDIDRERISDFFFGSPDMSWQDIITTYNNVKKGLKNGYRNLAATSYTLKRLNPRDKKIILKKQVALSKLE